LKVARGALPRASCAAMASEERYPVGRMAANLLLLCTLGSLTSFSIWPKQDTWPAWSARDFQLVYSAGLFGAWSQPLGGVLYDVAGPRWTKFTGICLVVVSFAALIACTGIPDSSPWLVGALYFLEEQGAATLQVAVMCDGMKIFPASRNGLTMGLCTLGYAASGLLWTFVFTNLHMQLRSIFMVVCASIILAVVPQFCTPVFEGYATERSPSLARYKKAFHSKQFLLLASLAVGVRAPAWAIIGLLKNLATASAASGVPLVIACLAVNVVLRFPVGWGYDLIKDRNPNLSVQGVLAFIVLVFFLGSACLVGNAVSSGSPALVWSGCLLIVGAFSCAAPLCNVWVREHFNPEVRGGVFGAHAISISFGNLFITGCFGPRETGSAADFLSLSVCIMTLAGFTAVLLTTIRMTAMSMTPAHGLNQFNIEASLEEDDPCAS